MAPAAIQFAEFMAGMDFRPPRIPVIANVTARPHDPEPEKIRDLLSRQIRASVRWTESVEFLNNEMGVTDFEEVGPGNVLTRLVQQIRADA